MRGNIAGVCALYCMNSGLLTHFSRDRLSSIGTPLIFVRRKYTNMGDIQANISNPVKHETPKQAIPDQIRISPR